MEDLPDSKDDVHKWFWSHHWICLEKYIQIDISHFYVAQSLTKVDLVILQELFLMYEGSSWHQQQMSKSNFDHIIRFVMQKINKFIYHTSL